VGRGEGANSILHFINKVHHCGIGRETDTGRGVCPCRAEIDGGGIRKILSKSSFCLNNEGIAVAEEEYPLGPVRLLEELDEGDGRPSLPRARRHDHE